MIVCAWGAIWLNPFAMVLFSVCISVTVECCVLYPCCMGVFGMLTVMYGIRLFSSVFAITERGDMGLYEVPLFVSLLGFGIGTMLANFHLCGIMFLLRAFLNILVRNASSRGPMYFRGLLISLSCLLFIDVQSCCNMIWHVFRSGCSLVLMGPVDVLKMK